MTNYLKRIEINPKILTGKPVIKGTRIPVEIILEKLAQNMDTTEVLKDYPKLEVDDIKAAVYFAKNILEKETIYGISS